MCIVKNFCRYNTKHSRLFWVEIRNLSVYIWLTYILKFKVDSNDSFSLIILMFGWFLYLLIAISTLSRDIVLDSCQNFHTFYSEFYYCFRKVAIKYFSTFRVIGDYIFNIFNDVNKKSRGEWNTFVTLEVFYGFPK